MDLIISRWIRQVLQMSTTRFNSDGNQRIRRGNGADILIKGILTAPQMLSCQINGVYYYKGGVNAYCS